MHVDQQRKYSHVLMKQYFIACVRNNAHTIFVPLTV